MKNLMLLNGRIYTMNPRLPEAEAVAIRDSKIVAVGRNSEVENVGRKNFKVMNLEGKTVIPGLIDCHAHLLSFAYSLKRVNLEGIDSFDEALSVIKSFSGKLKSDEWLLGGGWDKNILGEETLFTRKILDEISPRNPVALQSKDHHLLWVNSKALQIARIDRTTPDPAGGRIERDEKTGEPTGILKENACHLVWEKIPPPSPITSKKLLGEALKIASSLGLTGIHDFEDHEAFELFQQLQREGQLPLRVCFWIPDQNLDSAISLGIRSGFGNENLRFGGVKLFSDGTLGSQTALMFEPYEGGKDNYGIEVTSQKELIRMVEKAHRAGISVAIHSIGDRGVHQALNAIEYPLQRYGKGHRLRHRIEHAQLLHPQDIGRFKKLEVIASVQPAHAPSDRDIAKRYWGKRCKLAYAYHTLLKSGARVVFGSDVPIETFDPLKGIHAAVTRQRVGEKESWYPEERVNMVQAILSYTLWASYASYEEDIKGSIQVGKLADLVILSRDIFEVNPEQLPQTRVECTILGGEITFQA